jgi:hypothetical protein
MDKPATQLVGRAGLRDNLLAVAEGDSSAPRVLPAALGMPYFKATRSTNQTINGTSGVKIQFATEIYDPYNIYDNATNYRATPNKAGVYLVGVYITSSNIPSAATSVQAHIYKNGSDLGKMVTVKVDSSSAHGVMYTTMVQMNGTSDYLEGWFQVSPGANVDFEVQGEFWAHAVGRL